MYTYTTCIHACPHTHAIIMHIAMYVHAHSYMCIHVYVYDCAACVCLAT